MSTYMTIAEYWSSQKVDEFDEEFWATYEEREAYYFYDGIVVRWQDEEGVINVPEDKWMKAREVLALDRKDALSIFQHHFLTNWRISNDPFWLGLLDDIQAIIIKEGHDLPIVRYRTSWFSRLKMVLQSAFL